MCLINQFHLAVCLFACLGSVCIKISRHLDVIVDLVLHFILIFDECTYSERIYDSLVRPFYKNNEETINNLSRTLESYFEKKTQQVQSKVSESASDSNKIAIVRN